MKLLERRRQTVDGRRNRGSVLIVVLWMALGLVSITLYFANSMSFELRASENRVSGIASEQAIDGAARYISYVLGVLTTNGWTPDPTLLRCEAVPVGESRFWLIGRDTNDPPSRPGLVYFGIVDEASKLNINATNTTFEILSMLPRMHYDFAASMISWRSTNVATVDFEVTGAGSETYSMMSSPYNVKGAPFETVDELRLVYGADFQTLFGEDLNLNGILDPNEVDENRNGQVDPGVVEYVTVYSREPNTMEDGSPRINIRNLNNNNRQALRSLLMTNLSNPNGVLQQLGLNQQQGNTPSFRSPLELFARSGMSPEEFAMIEPALSTTTNALIEGRININTASAVVLACLPGLTNRAQEVVAFRQNNPTSLASTAWLLEALSLSGEEARLFARQLGDRITTRSYQFSVDVAALGPHGRGYRRVRFIFDTTEGTPKIIHRRELTQLGWALGKEAREVYLAKNNRVSY